MAVAYKKKDVHDRDDIAPVMSLFHDRAPRVLNEAQRLREALDSGCVDSLHTHELDTQYPTIIIDGRQFGRAVVWLERIVNLLHWVEGGFRKPSRAQGARRY